MPVLQPKEARYTIEDYYNTSGDERVELIDGVFYDIASPSMTHQIISMELSTEINNYIRSNNGDCRVFAAPFDVRPDVNDDTTVVVPDISVICDREKLTKRGCEGAPDWIIEIVSPGNVTNDYIRKLNVYRKAGVRLYWIINPDDLSVSVYDFSNGNLMPEYHTFDENIDVSIFDSFAIDFTKIKESLIS